MLRNGFWFFFFVLFCSGLMAQKPLRITCLGGSMTYGVQVANSSKNAFPVQLQYLLGNRFEVLNFGVANASLLNAGLNGYSHSHQFRQAIRSGADIFILNFGTVESAQLSTHYLASFETSYAALIQELRHSNKEARIILLKSPPAFTADTNFVHAGRIRSDINPAIERLAYRYHTEIIDLYSSFIERPDLFPDAVHPSSLGATVIAKRLYDVVRLKEDRPLFSNDRIPTIKNIQSFYGFEQIDFVFNGRACRIVKPRRVAMGHPWVWRARFWGHEPQTDIALLEKGFHLVYCDVAELYGNKESIQLWDAFYDLMQGLKLSPKVVLEAMSRGAVYAYNWALVHPERVAAIYADAPVLDLKSWPGGKGKGPGSAYDWDQFKKDYELNDSTALLFTGSPLDRTTEIIRSHYPILHVVGDADEVVPLQENTALFEKRLLEGGRAITVIHKPGIGHHPHSLPDPAPIVDFILRATGHKTNFADLPAPGAEYRSGAGWKEGADWWQQQEDINMMLLSKSTFDILFVGNSITQGIGGERPNVSYKPGKRIFDSVFAGFSYISAGISGDRTQQVLWRLQNGPLKQVSVKWIVLTIGVNNFPDDGPEEIVAGIRSSIEWIRKNKPGAKLICLGPLPAGMTPDHSFRKKYEAVHQLLKNQIPPGVIYLSVRELFILKNGAMDPALYSSDGIHLLEKGYAQWAEAIKSAMASATRN